MKLTLASMIAGAAAAFFFGFINQPESRETGALREAALENRTAIAEAQALWNQ